MDDVYIEGNNNVKKFLLSALRLPFKENFSIYSVIIIIIICDHTLFCTRSSFDLTLCFLITPLRMGMRRKNIKYKI